MYNIEALKSIYKTSFKRDIANTQNLSDFIKVEPILTVEERMIKFYEEKETVVNEQYQRILYC